jgi:hypothetical protein
MPQERACPGLGDPPVVTAAVAARWRRWPACPPAGGRRGSAARGRSRWWRSSSRGVRDARVGGGELRRALGGLRGLVQDPAQPRRALPGMCPCRTVRPRVADRRGQPGPAGQLAGAGETRDVTDLGEHDQGGELPDPGQRPQYLDSRVGLGVGVQLTVDPVGQRRQAAGDRQAVGDDLPRRRRQDPARPASRGPARTR